jgi:malonyl-CoA/methylmalonyl-CoA synthetase
MRDPCDWIDAIARDEPGRPFLHGAGGSGMTYAELRRAVGRFAAALDARGLAAGDRVVVQVEKSPDAVLLYLACLTTGTVFVPVNVANTAHELGHFLRDARPGMLVVRPQDHTVLEPLAAACGISAVETLGSSGEGSLARLAAGAAARDRPAFAGGLDAPAAIVYTSGTTGRSKGAVLTRGNLSSNATVLAQAWRFTASDVLLHTLPLFHVHGLFAALNTVLAAGASLILMPRFAAAEVLAGLPQASVYMGVPTHYTRMLQEPGLDRDSTASIRLFVSGSAPLPAETLREFARRTGHTILERYGMTETLMITSNPHEGVRVPGSVGPPLPGIRVRIAAVDGRPAQTGPIEVSGPNVFAGYWGDPEKTRAEFTADGWFKTGDLGCIDADGYVTIVGRAKDLVITGGYNVYPKEVESALDAIDGVMESAVFGVPHPDYGEGVTAVVVPAPGARLAEAQLLEAVKVRLAGYKVPKRIVIVDELPRNAMGKVQKNVLRDAYAGLFRAG